MGRRRLIQGVNDFAAAHPELLAEWDYEANGALKPENIFYGSGMRVYWICKLGHKYDLEICGRGKGQGCPFCSGKRVLPGFNDLATARPDIAAEWDYEKNEGLKPQDVTVGSGKRKLWWKCGRGHGYEAYVYSRTGGHGCPYCAGKKAWPGFNDLATLRPDLASQWDNEKNNGLTPDKVTCYSVSEVWWRCKLGHSWQAKVSERSVGNDCPFCSGLKAWPGFNDLASRLPDIAATWNVEKNGDLTPQMVTCGSERKVWWKCENHHEWLADVAVRKNHGCPYCYGIMPYRRRLVP